MRGQHRPVSARHGQKVCARKLLVLALVSVKRRRQGRREVEQLPKSTEEERESTEQVKVRAWLLLSDLLRPQDGEGGAAAKPACVLAQSFTPSPRKRHRQQNPTSIALEVWLDAADRMLKFCTAVLKCIIYYELQFYKKIFTSAHPVITMTCSFYTISCL